MATVQSLIETLQKCLHRDSSYRISAHQELESMRMFPEYSILLLQIISTHADDAIRKLAAVNLKNTIDGILWQVLDSNRKLHLKTGLMNLIGDRVRVIRYNVALTISKIAHLEFPEDWPSFFEDLVRCLRTNDVDVISGCIRVLADFVRDDLTDLSFPLVAPLLLPELYRLFDDSTIPPSIRGFIVATICEFAEIIHMVKEEHPNAVDDYLVPMLNMWMPGFVEILSKESTLEFRILKNEVVKAVVRIFRAFPKNTSHMALEMMQLIWKDVAAMQEMYVNLYVNPSPDEYEPEEDYGDEGEPQNLETYLYASLDFIQLVCRKKSVRSVFAKSLNNITKVLITYLQISTALEISWGNDMNQFILDDEEESFSHNVRVAVDQTLISLVDGFPKEASMAIFETCRELITIAGNNREAGIPSWWKLSEACLFSLGRFPDEMIELVRNSTINMDFIFTGVLIENIKCVALPLLQGRALWCASQYSGSLPPKMTTDYLAASSEALNSKHVSFAVRIFAAKSVKGFLLAIDNIIATPFQGVILQGLLQLIPESKEDISILLLETLQLAIKINQETCAKYGDYICDVLLSIWSGSAHDVFLMDLLQDIFTELSGNPFLSVQFQTRMYPAILESLTPEMLESTPGKTATALDLLRSVIKNVPDPLPPIYINQMYPVVIHILLNAEESALLQNGEELLRTLVHRDFDGLRRWTNGEKNGLELLLEFVAKMLAPTASESSAIFLGNLLRKLITKGGHHIVPYLPQILEAVVCRLDKASMPAFIETLILIFCALIETQCATVIDFLAGIRLENDRSGLSVFLNNWCECFPDLQGFYQVKLATTALMLVLNSNDERLLKVNVKGYLLEDSSSNKIVTRSMSKKKPDVYSTVPFPVKAVGLLADEYVSQRDSKMKGAKKSLQERMALETADDEEYFTDEDDDADLYPYLDEFDEVDYESDDSEVVASPIYSLDLESEIKNCFVGLYQNNTLSFRSICSTLPARIQKILNEMN